MPHKLAIELYDLWCASNYVALPYGTGALMLEPWWIRDAFLQLSAIDGWHQRQAAKRHEAKERRRRPPGGGFNFDESG